jgi:hypothetical protein
MHSPGLKARPAGGKEHRITSRVSGYLLRILKMTGKIDINE